MTKPELLAALIDVQLKLQPCINEGHLLGLDKERRLNLSTANYNLIDAIAGLRKDIDIATIEELEKRRDFADEPRNGRRL